MPLRAEVGPVRTCMPLKQKMAGQNAPYVPAPPGWFEGLPDTVLKGRNSTSMQESMFTPYSVLQDGPVGPHISISGNHSVAGHPG